MHACLGVDEILRLLAHELVASNAKATAVALACCRKSFEDPTLDVLWKTQEQLLPLLKSLPRDVWDGDGCTSFRRFPTTLEWVHFRKYSRRMRTLRQWGNPSSQLSPEVFAVLQSRAINEPLFPNLKSLDVWSTVGEFVPFIPSFLSPRTTSIRIAFLKFDTHQAVFASIISTIPTLCPNLQTICLEPLPRDPIITAAVSQLLLTTNRDALRHFRVDSPLTEEAREVIYKLPDLCESTVVVEGSTSLPTMVLPNLTKMDLEYDHNLNWMQGFRGAALGRLDFVIVRPKSESAQVAGFLEAFEGLATSATRLSVFKISTRRPWRPNYRSLLSFKQLTSLEIGFSCEGGCSSTVDDDIIVDMARSMPMLETLQLGEKPCGTPAGVTANGLAILAHHCPNLCFLSIHFRVDSFDVLPAIIGTLYTGTAAPRSDCALTSLDVGQIPLPEGSKSVVALTLLRIFPNLTEIFCVDESWGEVLEAIGMSE